MKELCCQAGRVSEIPCFSLLCVLPGTDTLGLTAGPLQPEPKETYYFVVQSISCCSSSLSHVPKEKR